VRSWAMMFGIWFFPAAKARNPNDYLNLKKPFIAEEKILQEKDMPIEFMMNALRLIDGVDVDLFSERTGLPLDAIQSELLRAKEKGFIQLDNNKLKTTSLGQRFLNDCLGIFM